MRFVLVFLVCLQARVSMGAFFIPGRTVAQREQICAERDRVLSAFQARDTSFVFKRMYPRSGNMRFDAFTEAGLDWLETFCVRYQKPRKVPNSIFGGELLQPGPRLRTAPCKDSDNRFHFQFIVTPYGKKQLRSVVGHRCELSGYIGPQVLGGSDDCVRDQWCTDGVDCGASPGAETIPSNSAIVPERCGCGLEQKRRLERYTYNEMFGSTVGYRLKFDCVDWDECKEIHGCPQFSRCVNTVGSYNCECMPGYHIAGDSSTRTGSYLDKCVLDGVKMTSVDTTFSTIRVKVLSPPSVIAHFKATLGVWKSPYKLTLPDRNSVRIISRAQAESSSGIYFNDLEPGTEYNIHLQSLNSAIQPFPGSTGSISIATTCSCDSGDGRPEDLEVEQQDGHVLFSFVDKSTCDEAFAFARREVAPGNSLVPDDDVFTPNYYYFASGDSLCKRVPYKPGKATSDDLRVSRLDIGKTFEYCVRGIAPRRGYTTEYTCTRHTIRWEASLAGVVRLHPEAKALPVRNVLVSYCLYSAENEEVRNGTVLTGPSGEFSVAFNEDLPAFTAYGQYRLHLEFAKVTSGVVHTFLCNDGVADCTESGTDTYLEHLRFRQPLEVIDDTSMPFSGVVVVENTLADDSLKGCPVVGAQVCLVDFTAGRTSVEPLCTKTDNTGRYTLPAVIGLRVSVSITYFNHTIRILDPAKQEAHEKGILIEPDGSYEDNDYVDVQKADIVTIVAGGLCNRPLGASKVRVKIANCPNWDGLLLEQTSYKFKHRVPAHDLLVTTEEIVGHLAATDVLSRVNKRIDLRSSAQSTDEPTPGEAAEDLEALETVRFQFNGTVQVSVRIRYEQEQSCKAAEVDPVGVVGAGTTSFHVVPLAAKLYTATFFLSQFLGTGIKNCDHLDSDTRLTITNSLGLVAGSQLDKDYREKLAMKLNRDNLGLMEVCNTGCSNISIIHSVIANVTGYAQVVLPFRISRPNKTPPFTKYLDIRIGGATPTHHRAIVVVTGNFDNENSFPFPLPTYKPLLVLRDPPGGLSYSYYKNMRSIVRVQMEDLRVWGGIDHNLDFTAMADSTNKACVGGGMVVLTMLCKKVLEAKIHKTKGWNGEHEFLGTLDHDQYGAEYALEWSYETSRDIWLAGQASDAFLVPNLNVVVSKYDVISFDPKACKGSSNQNTFFDLDSVENEPAVAFYSRSSVERQVLPELLKLQQEYDRLLRSATDVGKVAEYSRNKEAVDEAYSSWREFLDDYIKTNAKINNGNLSKVAPHQWFESWVSTKDKGRNEPPMPAVWGGMIPKSLADRANAQPLKWESKQRIQGADEIERTHLIKFAGGGGLVHFQMKHGKTEEHISKLGRPDQNSESYNTRYIKLAKGLKGNGLGTGGDLEGGVKVRIEHEFLRTDDTEDATTVGFVLGDSDIGDLFDVLVHFDPHFGTFAFNTVSGKSKCPYELNTRRREAVKLQIFPPTGPVLPEDPMIFRLLITNEGEDRSSYQLSVDHRTNPGMLVHSINGDTLTVPQQYDRIEAGQTVATSMSIYRGPELFDYPPLRLAVQSSCEAIRNFGDGNLFGLRGGATRVSKDVGNKDGRIVFTQPCQRISWAGKLEREGTFISNTLANVEVLRVVVQNEGALSFAESVRDSRLTKVELLYRRRLDSEWIRASGRKVGESVFELVDFTADGIEDEYGFAEIEWLLPIFDGDYELAARSICEQSVEAELDTFMTPIISGTIDRVKPEPFGLPSPSFREVFSTDEFSFRFTEPIDCARPYSLRFNVTFTGLSLAYETDELRVICVSQEGKISFMLPSDAKVDRFLGRGINIELTNVQDIAGNKVVNPVTLQSTYRSFNASTDLVFFRLSMGTSCTSAGLNQNETVTGLVSELAGLLQVEPARIEISGIGCLSRTQLTAVVRIVPIKQENPTLRRLQVSTSGIDLYQQLKAFNLAALPKATYPYLSNAYLDESTFEIVDDVSGPETTGGDEIQAVQITRTIDNGGMESLQQQVAQVYAAVVSIGCIGGVAILAMSAQYIRATYSNDHNELSSGLDDDIVAHYTTRKSSKRSPNPHFEDFERAESIHADDP